MEQQREDVGRRSVGPLHVVQQNRYGPWVGQELEQRSHATRDPVPAVSRGRFNPGHARDRRQDGGEVGQVLAVETARRVCRQSPVKRVDQQREGEVALELRGAAREHQVSSLTSPVRNLGQQARLADSGLAAQAHRPCRAAFHLAESALEYAELVPASHEGRLWSGHEARVTRRTADLLATTARVTRCVTDLSRRRADRGEVAQMRSCMCLACA